MKWLAIVVLVGAWLGPQSVAAQPAHPAVRYSCMGDPPPGEPWPWVEEGVPYAIERMHPGYGIHGYDGFTVAGVSLFQVVGARRGESADDHYTQVEGIDEAGTVLTDRALFLRAASGVTDARELALRAMAILLRRADARPLMSGSAAMSELVRDRIARPVVIDGTLVFWLRIRSDSPHAAQVTVELASGIARGDWG